jgi:two-component system, cell cycle response regulator
MKLLIAEDDRLFQKIVVELLAPDYDLILARDGIEAWAELQRPEAPRLAILDWVMPGLNGPQICRRVRACPPLSSIYLILLTAKNNEDDIVAGLRSGADDYITKPPLPAELRARIKVGERILALQDALQAQSAIDNQGPCPEALPPGSLPCYSLERCHSAQLRDGGFPVQCRKPEEYRASSSGESEPFTHRLFLRLETPHSSRWRKPDARLGNWNESIALRNHPYRGRWSAFPQNSSKSAAELGLSRGYSGRRKSSLEYAATAGYSGPADFGPMMPGMDGVELCRRIRRRSREGYQYIVLVSGKDQRCDVIEGLNAGADDYLTKPFDIGELQARLRTGNRILSLQRDLIQAREALRYQATHDSLTDLWCRGATLQLLGVELDRGRRFGTPTGVLMIDLDHFKNVNDTHGHLIGDAVLVEAGRRIARAVRSYDFVGRYGGEEFLAVLSKCTIEEVRTIADRARVAVAESAISVEGTQVAVSVSIGGAVASEGLDDADLLSIADHAVYEAKRQGRNRVVIGSCQASRAQCKGSGDSGTLRPVASGTNTEGACPTTAAAHRLT